MDREFCKEPIVFFHFLPFIFLTFFVLLRLIKPLKTPKAILLWAVD